MEALRLLWWSQACRRGGVARVGVRSVGREVLQPLGLCLGWNGLADQRAQRALVRQRRRRVLGQALRLQHPHTARIQISPLAQVRLVQQPSRKTPDLLMIRRGQLHLLALQPELVLLDLLAGGPRRRVEQDVLVRERGWDVAWVNSGIDQFQFGSVAVVSGATKPPDTRLAWL